MERHIRRAVVLGAGASCSYDESPTGMRPPLAREIIPTYTRLPMSEDRYVLVGHLVNYIKRTRGIAPAEFSTWHEDVETFFSEVDEQITIIADKILAGAKLSQDELFWYQLSLGVYSQMIFLFASIFNEIQNGPVSVPYSLLAHELECDDALITFNWDTLLDRALLGTGKWSPSNGYLLRPEAIYDDGWKTPDMFPTIESGPLYLKLHGSTNWLAPYHQPGVHHSTGKRVTLSRYALDKLYVFLQATRPYETYEGRYRGPYQPFSYGYYPPNLPQVRDDVEPGWTSVRFVIAPDLPVHGKNAIGETDVFSMPLIVPPVRNKQYQRYGRIFANLWSAANQILSACETLYLFGYSFPPTDLAAKEMFKSALETNSSLKRVIILNPFPDGIYELLTKDFGLNPDLIEVRAQRFEVRYDRAPKLL